MVSFHFGLPAEELLASVKSSGSKVLASATTVEEALLLESRGVDAIIAQGAEAGGHLGMFLTDDITRLAGGFALLPLTLTVFSLWALATLLIRRRRKQRTDD